MKVWLGLDAGSVSLKTVILNEQQEVLFEDYRRTQGRPFATAAQVLEELSPRFSSWQVQGAATTGSGGAKLAEALGARFVNEVVALSTAVRSQLPHVRTVVEIGGQDSKMLLFEQEKGGSAILRDFSMNSLCAAGTGSFLDQQASRLGVAIEEEFGQMALRSEAPPRIAGRCSVFAKSDMIHLQQIATPVHDIAAGLCLALARSFKATVGKGKNFHRPIAFVGGVASNAGMKMAFEKVLELSPGELLIPPHHNTLGALGAVLTLLEKNIATPFRGHEALLSQLGSFRELQEEPLEKLRPHLTAAGTPSVEVEAPCPARGERIPAYIGIDIGSVSTNVVVIDESNRVLAKRYLWTASRPIEAVRQGLDEIRAEVGDRIEVRAAGTTGSGRYLIGQMVGADVIRNEITAQATAAVVLDPQVDTIFEIGGQDSKYISLENGAVCDFEMNKACAAGTGSFLAEQAERLDVDLKKEFGVMALDAPAPVSLGERCTVFMESDLVAHQQQGATTENLLAGLAYSVVRNYLNRVVGDRRIGQKIFFQGGTAFNKAVVAAFNSVLGKEVVVPAHHEMTGAIGAAILAREKQVEHTRFRGFEFSDLSYEVKTFVCRSCDNLCEIRQVKLEGERPLYYGSRCEKYEVERHSASSPETTEEALPDLFAEREALLLKRWGGAGKSTGSPAPRKPRVGIPLVLSFHEFLPFWRTFFEELGYEVLISGNTTKATVQKGVESVVAEVCFPIKIAHGHLLQLLEKKPDLLFVPGIVDSATEEFGPGDRTAYNCPLAQALPYTSRCGIDFDKLGVPVFAPVLRMQWGVAHLARELAKSRRVLKVSRRAIVRALEMAREAQASFARALEERGRQVLENLPSGVPALVVVARPYNGCDLGLNLDLPRKLRNLGALAIPMDFLPLSRQRLSPRWQKVYWRYGQRILNAAELIRQDPRLFGVYLTNFSCGPDSFLLDYFRTTMGGKPHLLLEIDEHSADAGLITRCEAFLDTLANVTRQGKERCVGKASPWSLPAYTNHRKLYMVNMAPQAHPLAAAFRSVGIEACVLEPSDKESVAWGERSTSGRQCYPCLLTAGDMLREAHRSGFDPDRAAFLMPSADGPCRFGQYHCLHRQVLDKAGLSSVPLFVLDQDSGYGEVIKNVGTRCERRAFQGVCAVDVFEKLLHETRPYEAQAGTTERWFWKWVHEVSESIESGGADLFGRLERAAAEHAQIEKTDQPPRPRIGIVGEIYVRTNAFANRDIVTQIEALGGEVLTPPVAEWIHYIHHCRALLRRARGQLLGMLGDTLRQKITTHDERAVYAVFGRTPDPHPAELEELARPYIHPRLEGEAILTIGKAVEYLHDPRMGGIVNLMPFTCMPGTISTALLKRLREDHGQAPVLTISLAGQQSSSSLIQLEAFIYQARQFCARRGEAACV